jgi:hypothetical protein
MRLKIWEQQDIKMINIKTIKNIYGAQKAYDNLDEEFKELFPVVYEKEDFFSIYNNKFYEIEKEGPLSHATLVERSARYAGIFDKGFEAPVNEELNDLKEQIKDLHEEIDSIEDEHFYFKNNTVLMGKEDRSVRGIMQSGKLRIITSRKMYQVIKNRFGFRGRDTSDFVVEVSLDTIEGLSKSKDIANEKDLNMTTLEVNRFFLDNN